MDEDKNSALEFQIIKLACEIRCFEEVLLENFSKLNARGTIHLSLGQELLPVTISKLIQEGDFLFGTHRSHAIFLAISQKYTELACEVLGVEGGISFGLGGSQHLHTSNLFTNGVLGGMSPLAVGAAHGILKKDNIAICFLGDGAMSQGVVYESLNLAATLKVPTLFIIEDNEVSQSTITSTVQSGSIQDKIEAFKIETFTCPNNNLNLLITACERVITDVRASKLPKALIVKQSRLGAHSKGDDNRKESLVEALNESDYLSKIIVNSEYLLSFMDNRRGHYRNLFKSLTNRPKAGRTFNKWSLNLGLKLSPSGVFYPDETIRQLTYFALKIALESMPKLFIYGQDIEWISEETEKPYGGAFGVTKDLSREWPNQIRNSPISESAQVGFGIGRALTEAPTIVEIMFGDFTTLILDQVRQQASKIVEMYGQRIRLPVLIRTPMGGRKGYGPTHSQNIENIFFAIPNVVVYCQNNFFNPKHISELLGLGYPIIMIENKDLYNIKNSFASNTDYDLLFLKKEDVLYTNKVGIKNKLIISYGHAAHLSLATVNELWQQGEEPVDVLCVTIVSPLNLEEHAEMIKAYNKILLVEECNARNGLIGSLVSEFLLLNIDRMISVCGGISDIGASFISEEEALISKTKIKRAIANL